MFRNHQFLHGRRREGGAEEEKKGKRSRTKPQAAVAEFVENKCRKPASGGRETPEKRRKKTAHAAR